MIKHHPDDNFLAEYSSGSLAWALSLSVRSHIELCSLCQQKVANLNKVGGALLNISNPESCSSKAIEKVMQRIRQTPSVTEYLSPRQQSVAVSGSNTAESNNRYSQDPLLDRLPKMVEKLVSASGSLKWQKISSALKTARLVAGQDEYEVAFQRIGRGGKVVEHDHRGLEVTLVLKGSFSDEKGVYAEGDFLVRNPGDVHRPTATENQDCLCLSVVAAPVKVTGFLGTLINPFLSIRPA
jgi:putative transcriptional regulator